MWRRRLRRPGFLVVFALVLIVGGCLAVETAATRAAGPPIGYRYGGQGQPGGPPVVGPLPQPAPMSPTWTGTLRVTGQGVNMSYQPPAADTAGGTATVQYNAGAGTLEIENSGPAAVWTAERDPTYDECVALVNAQPLSQAEMTGGTAYQQGQGLCVVTFSEQAMAFVRGISAPRGEAVQMSARRWPVTQN